MIDREKDFRNAVYASEGYDQKLKEEFFNYWSEPNKTGKKMRWEMEKTWDLARRLKRWSDNQIKWNAKKLGTSDARIERASTW